MFPDQMIATNGKNSGATLPEDFTTYDQLQTEFVGEVRSQLATLTGEIGLRNKVIQQNDGYIYGDLLEREVDIPIGHDKTAVNWLRRTVEIHRTQVMGRGFTVVSTYDSEDIENGQTDDDKQRLQIENKKRKDFAETRRQLIDAIVRDNGGHAMFADAAENAGAVGFSVFKNWYDEDQGKYVMNQIETVENCYALWSRDDFRRFDMFAYVYQVTKEEAKRLYGINPQTVPTSPLGMPLAVLTSANIVRYISTQPMVTIMEIAGKPQGWRTNGNGTLERCKIGQETSMNAVIVGNTVYQLNDDQKYIPHYYILQNRRARRRPWGIPDVTDPAIRINQTYIETLSDWRTLGSKVNFPKFKGYGFGLGTQLPVPKARKTEILPMAEGQDIQPLQMSNSAQLGQVDFRQQMEEEKEQFMLEVGIPPSLFNRQQDTPSNSNQVEITAMKSLGDIVANKQQLWTPVITQMFEDALHTLALFDDSIKDLVDDTENWHLRVMWPSALNKDDPVHQTMMLNRFNANTISLQTYLESIGETKEELDRIRDEMEDNLLAAIHGKIVGSMAQLKIMPAPSMSPPKVNVNLRGDISPGQEANLSAMHGFNNGPIVGPTVGPQGNTGLKATDDFMNQGMIQGQQSVTMPVIRDANGQPVQLTNPSAPNGQMNPSSPGVSTPQPVANQSGQEAATPMGTPANNVPGTQPMSQAGTGAPATSPQGRLNKQIQRKGG